MGIPLESLCYILDSNVWHPHIGCVSLLSFEDLLFSDRHPLFQISNSSPVYNKHMYLVIRIRSIFEFQVGQSLVEDMKKVEIYFWLVVKVYLSMDAQPEVEIRL